MTQEAQLERIALNLEKLISIISSSSAPLAAPAVSNDNVAPGAEQFSSPSATANAPAAEPPKRGRGRPAKGEQVATPVDPTPVTATAQPTVQAASDFLSIEPAAKQVTVDEVRAALAVYQTANDQGKAVALFKANSGGAETFPQLKPENYHAVFAAALPGGKFTQTHVRDVLVAAEGRKAAGGQKALKDAGGVTSLGALADDKFVAVILAAHSVR